MDCDFFTNYNSSTPTPTDDPLEVFSSVGSTAADNSLTKKYEEVTRSRPYSPTSTTEDLVDVDLLNFMFGGGYYATNDRSSRPVYRPKPRPWTFNNNNTESTSDPLETFYGLGCEKKTDLRDLKRKIGSISDSSSGGGGSAQGGEVAVGGEGTSTSDTTSVVTLNNRVFPHVPTEYPLPSPSSLYEGHPQLREHEDCPGDNCKRGSCRLRQMIPQMDNGGDLEYSYDARIDPTQFTGGLHELGCPLVADVLEKVYELDYPTSKPKPTQRDLVMPDVKRDDTYTGSQMMAMEGTIIMGYNGRLRGQDGYDTVLEICVDNGVDWADSIDLDSRSATHSRKEEIAQNIYDETIRRGFNWVNAINQTKGKQGCLYKLEAVTHFSNNNDEPFRDGSSPRQYIFSKMSVYKDQAKAAKAKKEKEKKKKEEKKAMLKRIEEACPLLGEGNCLSVPNFDVCKKISKADIARVEKEIKAVEAMQTVITPTSDLMERIIHIPTVYIFVAYAPLFEFFLKMYADESPCKFEVLCDTIQEHTGLDLSNFIHKGMSESYKECWDGDWKQVLRDLVCYLPLLLAGKSARYPDLLGMTWQDLQNSEWDHLLDLFIKKDGVGQLRKDGYSLSIIMIEACKCAAMDASSHERGKRRDHAVKLGYKLRIHYNFDGAGITSPEQFFNSKEILQLREVLEHNDLLNMNGDGLPPEVSWSAIKVMLWLTVGVVLSDIHPKTDKEWQTQMYGHRETVNQILLYLYKSISKNPNPNGPRFSDIIPIRKSGVHMHHPINYQYDVMPSDLMVQPTEYMISELISGKCISLLNGDHKSVTGYEKKWWKDIPEWLKKFSRFQYNY